MRRASFGLHWKQSLFYAAAALRTIFSFFFSSSTKNIGIFRLSISNFVISSFRFAQKGSLADSIHCLLLTIGYCDALLAGINGPSSRRNLCPFFFHPFAITIFLATKPRHHNNTDRPRTPRPRQKTLVCFHHIVQNVYLTWLINDYRGMRETRWEIRWDTAEKPGSIFVHC